MDPRRVALVTGAGRGIGRAIAVALARDGFDVVVNDLPASDGAVSSDAAETVALIRQVGRDACAIPADVGERADVEQLFTAAIERFGRLDAAVANAAYNVKRTIAETDWSTARRIIDVTMCGALHVAQLAAKQMMAQAETNNDDRTAAHSSILLIGSIHAELAIPYHGVYAMAKSAVNQLCRSLAVELIPFRIRVNAINPGWIDTPGERAYLSESQLQQAATQLPWGRLGTPEEVASLAAYLISPSASYITGSIHSIDGGLRLDNSQIDTGLTDQ